MKRPRALVSALCAVVTICALALAAVPPASAAAGSSGRGQINEYTFPSPRSGPSVVMRAPDGAIWVALARVGKLARMRDGRIQEFPLLANSFPVGMAIDSNGLVWYSDIRRNKIGRLDPASGAVLEFDIPTPDSWPFFIVVHPDGYLWFTQRMGNNIARLDPRSGEVREFRVPTPNCQPAGMTVTPQGQIFFTENSGNKVGHMDPNTERLVEHEVPTPMTPSP